MGTCTFSFESRVANTSTPASTHSQNPSGTVGSGSDGDAKCWLIHLRPSQMPAQCGGDKPIADMSSNALPLPCPHPSDTLQSEVFIVAISSAFPLDRTQGSASAATDCPQFGLGHAPADVLGPRPLAAQGGRWGSGAKCAAHVEHVSHPDATRNRQHGSADAQSEFPARSRGVVPGGHCPAAHSALPCLPRLHELQHQDFGCLRRSFGGMSG